MQSLLVSWDKDEALVMQRRKGNRASAKKPAGNAAALSAKKRGA